MVQTSNKIFPMEFGSLHQQCEIKINKKPWTRSGLVKLPDEDENLVYYRQALCTADIKTLDETIAAILEQSNAACVDLVLKFLDFKDTDLIPTGVVLGGHSGSDRNAFYKQLGDHDIQTCILESIDSVKDCIKKLNDDFVGKNEYCDHDIEKLVGWYASFHVKPRLVVIVPDFEGFDSTVLQKVIQICHGRRHQVPVSFVLGVATNMNTVHQNLSKAAFGCLNTKLFSLANSRECINQMIDQVEYVD